MKKNIIQCIEKTIRLYPDKVAVKDRKGEITFSELVKQAKVLATYLLSFKSDNRPVPVFIPKSKEMIVAFLGINYSGNFYVPLDTKSPANRIQTILKVLDAPFLLTTTDSKKLLPELENIPVICIDEVIGFGNLPDESLLQRVLGEKIDTDPVYSIFTSGSTGTPKGVVISHRGVLDYIDWAVKVFAIDEKHIIGNQAPFYFDNSTLDIYLMYATGATLVIVPEEYYIFPAKLIDYLNENRVNFIFWVPFALMNVANLNILEQKPLLYMKKVLFAGEVMPNKHLNYWRKHMPDCIYVNLYGPTEITVDCTYYIVDREFSDDESLPIGRACDNTGILILNENNEEAKINEIGELCVRGSSLALGYYNDWEKTNKAFVQNPLNKVYPEIIYRTGDLVFFNERQEIIYVGRKDSQIKHNGYRIELGEIETAVLASGMVKNVCVLYDFSKKQIVLFYEAVSDLDLALLRKELLKYIPKYMVPSQYIRLERLPVNSNGKIDRLVLSKQINESAKE